MLKLPNLPHQTCALKVMRWCARLGPRLTESKACSLSGSSAVCGNYLWKMNGHSTRAQWPSFVIACAQIWAHVCNAIGIMLQPKTFVFLALQFFLWLSGKLCYTDQLGWCTSQQILLMTWLQCNQIQPIAWLVWIKPNFWGTSKSGNICGYYLTADFVY